MDCFRRKKTVSIGSIRIKIRGTSINEPTKDELIEILNTFSTVDEDDNWVFYLNRLNLDYKRSSIMIIIKIK